MKTEFEQQGALENKEADTRTSTDKVICRSGSLAVCGGDRPTTLQIARRNETTAAKRGMAVPNRLGASRL